MFKQLTIATLALLTAESQAINMKADQRAKMDAAVENYLNADSGSEAEWGFLKNIVNIDRFFDSGVKA